MVERGKHAAVTFIDLLRISKPQTVRELGIVWIGSGLIRRFERSWDAVCRRQRVARTCFFVRALFLYGCVDGFVVWGERLGVKRGGENSDGSGSVPLHFEKRRVGKNALPALRAGIDFNRACLYPSCKAE